MEHILQALIEGTPSADIQPLVELVDALRPKHCDDIAAATNNFQALTFLLNKHAEYRKAFRHYLFELVSKRNAIHLFTDVGILPNASFGSELKRKLGFKLLPPAYNDNYLRDVLGQVFHQKTDHVWFNALPEDIWEDVANALALDAGDEPSSGMHFRGELLDAVQVLSYRISSIGLEPELVRNYPAIEEYESPFLMQNVEVRRYLDSQWQAIHDTSTTPEDTRQILVLLDQCHVVIDKARKHAQQNGVSVSFTYLLQRLKQSEQRLRTLLALLDLEDSRQRRQLSLALLRELLYADNHKYDLRNFISSNAELLANKVTEHASKTGEHYVTHSKADYLQMLRAAMGAGLIIGFMALIKIGFAKLKAPPLVEAFLFSMNYSLGFMLVHVLHFTIATKQPAMTAAHIAEQIRESNGGEATVESIADLAIKVFRTQFVAILGNVCIAMPTAYVIALCGSWLYGGHWITPEKAQHLLHELDPLRSLALFHAAIAGVCLFLAGLISGYHDNTAIYHQIPERIAQLPWLRRLFGAARAQRLGNYLGDNLGGLAGNFYFGIMLGSIGTLGFILGLPIDIRHITFSAANFAYALVALDHQIGFDTALTSMLGIVGIGSVNLLVSFGLALFVALKSRRARFNQKGAFVREMARRFMRTPGQFFMPPRNDDQAGQQQ
ncbi:MAG: recombinase [Neisseriaceae bacterium]|nr:MAG: recombinase [Neisseriaceae bacterium]